MSRRGLRLLVAACAVSALWLLKDGFLDLGLGFLFLTPAILLALPLLAGRYVGAERLRGGARRRPRAARRATPSPLSPRAGSRMLPRGGVLIAASLAVRPPPLVLCRQ
jgi:hypothetical protein